MTYVKKMQKVRLGILETSSNHVGAILVPQVGCF